MVSVVFCWSPRSAPDIYQVCAQPAQQLADLASGRASGQNIVNNRNMLASEICSVLMAGETG